MKIPVLTYHSMRIHGNEYASNDLVALAADLETLRRKGFEVRPLRELVDAWLDTPQALQGRRVAAITCDDGGDFDFHDLPHPTAGTQRSVLNILRDSEARGFRAHATSFVIVSPEARAELDRSCMIGRGWWNDAWWPQAVASGLMHVGNHSWDHNHDALPESFSHGVERGTFRTIDREALADAEIRMAAQLLRRRAPNPGDHLFAYPYGESNPYLVTEYFPRHGEALGIRAACCDDPEHWRESADRWRIPRFICARDWKSPGELERILDAAAERA